MGKRHRKQIRHYHQPGDMHELTFSCYRRLPLLSNDDLWQVELSRSINAAAKETDIELAAFVFMPEHVHLLVVPTISLPDIPRYLALVKQQSSKSIKQLLLQVKSPLIEKLTIQEDN